jgi:hypothetical protein
LAKGEIPAKYTVLDVAQWLDDMSSEASRHQALATSRVYSRNAPEFRRVAATDSAYPMLYYFEVHGGEGSGIYPGFGPDLSNQPYYLVRSNRMRG